MIELRDVSYAYGKGPAVLDSVSLRLEPGDNTCLVGSNGAGKSTLISLVVGRRRPGCGKVRVNGGDPRDWRSRQGVGYMPQASQFPPLVSVGFVLSMCASLAGVDLRAERGLLDTLGLGTRSDERCGALSGGWARRLSLACAMMAGERVLILDEPTAGLDADGVAIMLNLLHRHRGAGGQTLWTTHSAEEPFLLNSKILVLHSGRVTDVGDLWAGAASLGSVVVQVRAGTGEPVIAGLTPRRVGALLEYIVPAHELVTFQRHCDSHQLSYRSAHESPPATLQRLIDGVGRS